MYAPKIKPNNEQEHVKNIIIDPTYCANDEEQEKKIEWVLQLVRWGIITNKKNLHDKKLDHDKLN